MVGRVIKHPVVEIGDGENLFSLAPPQASLIYPFIELGVIPESFNGVIASFPEEKGAGVAVGAHDLFVHHCDGNGIDDRFRAKRVGFFKRCQLPGVDV